jgi:hypothetical protein
MCHVTSLIASLADLDNTKALLIQCMDIPSTKVRTAAAQTLARVLLSLMKKAPTGDTFNDNDGREKLRKRKTVPIKADDEGDGRSSPAPTKSPHSIPLHLSFRDLLRHLSTTYVYFSSRHVRTGIMISYTTVFKSLGPQSANTNYSIILEHLLDDVAAHPRIKDDRYRTLETRRHIKVLLCDVLRRQLLNEPAKIMALRTIINVLQKGKKEGNVSDTSSYFIEPAVCALNELAGLLQDLGSATSSELVSCFSSTANFNRSHYRKFSGASLGILIPLCKLQLHGD